MIPCNKPTFLLTTILYLFLNKNRVNGIGCSYYVSVGRIAQIKCNHTCCVSHPLFATSSRHVCCFHFNKYETMIISTSSPISNITSTLNLISTKSSISSNGSTFIIYVCIAVVVVVIFSSIFIIRFFMILKRKKARIITSSSNVYFYRNNDSISTQEVSSVDSDINNELYNNNNRSIYLQNNRNFNQVYTVSPPSYNDLFGGSNFF